MQFHLFHKLFVITQLWASFSKQVLVQSSHKQGKHDYNLKVKCCFKGKTQTSFVYKELKLLSILSTTATLGRDE